MADCCRTLLSLKLDPHRGNAAMYRRVLWAVLARRWVTVVLVAVYSLGVLGPTAAFALAEQASIVHSMTESHGGLFTPHVHSEHKGHSNKIAPGANHHCCGIVSLPGLEILPMAFFHPATLSSEISSQPERGLSGGTPDRLDRPPRFLQSL